MLGPLFNFADGLVAPFAPEWVRLIIWSSGAGVLGMLLYRAVSPQAAIARIEAQTLEVRKLLDAYEGELSGAQPLLWRSIALAFKRLGLSLGPALLAGLPPLLLLIWMEGKYAYEVPAPREKVIATVVGHAQGITWVPATDVAQAGDAWEVTWPAANEKLTALWHGKETLTLPHPEPVPTLQKRSWWHFLYPNSLGYLPDDTPAERLTFDLRWKEYLPLGPSWMRSWLTVFMLSATVASLAVKFLFKLK